VKVSKAQVRLLAKLYSGKKVRWHENYAPPGYSAGDAYGCRLLNAEGLLIGGNARDDRESLFCALALLRRGLIEEERRDEYGPICRISQEGRTLYEELWEKCLPG
jgi:hypothetical protein